MSDLPAEADEDAAATMTPASDRMKTAREAAGMSLADIADTTRVPLRHLAALEDGDYAALPGVTYCAGFARAYARAVGMDEAALVSQVREEIVEMGGIGQDPYEFQEAVNPARIPPRWLAWTAAIVALLLVGAYGIWRTQYTTPPTDDQIAAQEAGSAPVTGPVRPAAVPTPTGPVVMTAADDVWMRIYQADGTRLYEGTLARGESYTVPDNARDPMILTGRPDALAVTVGGQAVPPLGTAERTISDVPVGAAALLARARDATSAEGAPVPTPPASTTAPAPAPPAAATVPAPELPALDGPAGGNAAAP